MLNVYNDAVVVVVVVVVVAAAAADDDDDDEMMNRSYAGHADYALTTRCYLVLAVIIRRPDGVS